MRDHLEPVTLWADALCINQADDDEKSEQVRARGQIYKRADNVWAWLGEQDDFSDLAFETLDIFFWATKMLIFQYCPEN